MAIKREGCSMVGADPTTLRPVVRSAVELHRTKTVEIAESLNYPSTACYSKYILLLYKSQGKCYIKIVLDSFFED